MADFLYTIRINFSDIDDVEAKKRVKKIDSEINSYIKKPETLRKLQRIYQNKSPKKVSL